MSSEFENELNDLINKLWDEIPEYTEAELLEFEIHREMEDLFDEWMEEVEKEFETSDWDVPEPPIWEAWDDENIKDTDALSD